MRILVIGSTGRTGRHVLDQALRRGHTVTAFTRRPDELAGTTGLHAVRVGDATDPDAVRAALVEQDCVICAIGTSAIVRTLIHTMPEAGVRRVVITSSRSIVATRPKLVISLVWLKFRAAYADLARAEGMLEGSALDWSIVRGAMLTDKPATGRLHTDFESDATGGDWQLTRADYATELLDVAQDNSMIQKAVGVAGARPRRADRPRR